MMKKDGIIRNALILCAITLIAGLLLAFVNQLTIGPIEKAQLQKQAQAYVEVFPEADSFGAVEGDADLMASADFAGAGYPGGYISGVMTALDANGNVVGYVLSAVSKSGYGGEITVALGIDMDGVITGFKPLQHGETVGFGAKCEEDSFRAQFPGLTSENEIDGISGATFSTNAIKEAVGTGLYFVNNYLLG